MADPAEPLPVLDALHSTPARRYLSTEPVPEEIIWALLGASIDGAVQNLILAARAYGIGTTLTTLYARHEDGVRDLLGLPGDALTMGLLPLGYPARGRWAQPKRRPVQDVVHWNRWGATRQRVEGTPHRP